MLCRGFNRGTEDAHRVVERRGEPVLWGEQDGQDGALEYDTKAVNYSRRCSKVSRGNIFTMSVTWSLHGRPPVVPYGMTVAQCLR